MADAYPCRGCALTAWNQPVSSWILGMWRAKNSEKLERFVLNRQALLGDDSAGRVMCAPVTRVTADRTRPELIADSSEARCALRRAFHEDSSQLSQHIRAVLAECEA